jgi:hypothetical protein
MSPIQMKHNEIVSNKGFENSMYSQMLEESVPVSCALRFMICVQSVTTNLHIY